MAIVLWAERRKWEVEALAFEKAWWEAHPPPSLADAEALSARLAERFGLARDVFRGKQVLDIGCGPTGRLSWFEGEFVGLDPLADVYRSLPGARLEKYRYLVSDGAEEQRPEWSERFDWIVSFNALDHGWCLPFALRNVAAWLRPGGRALLSVGCDQIHEPGEGHPLKLHPAMVSGLLMAVGLEIEGVDMGRFPVGTEEGIVMHDTCSGGPVFHWTCRKPEAGR
jgi:SAM-dependent methyltransferase